MKKNNQSMNWKEIDDVVFVPTKKGHLFRNSLLILLGVFVVIFLTNPGNVFKQISTFPKEKLVFSEDTSVFCEDRNVSMTGPVTNYLTDRSKFNYEFSLKTDFIGKITNSFFLPARNVKLGVRIQGISNPSAAWWMGTTTIKEIPANTTVDFDARLDHLCAQRDIKWTYVVIDASY